MSNSVVLITGALTGIGRAAAIAFARKGAKVVVAGRREDAGKALVEEMRSFGSEAEFINANVRREDDVRALVDKTVARFGRLRCRGEQCRHRRPGWPDHGPVCGELRRDVRHECSRRDPEHEARSARHARTGQRHYQHLLDLWARGGSRASVYVGSKYAVEGITKSVALELAMSGIRVNGVAPGSTDTGMLTRFTGKPENKAALVTGVPMGRLGLSEELADAIVAIASEEASFITGHILNVDSGHTAN